MSKLRLLAILATALAATLLLSACGGDDDDGGGEDEDAITATIETVATSTNADEICETASTQAFVEQTQAEVGEEAVAACQEDAGSAPADSVEVSNIAVEGETATAEAAFEGGRLNGQTIAVGLVKEGDQWKADSLEDFVEFDQAAFAAGVAESAGEDGDAPQELIDCVRETIEQGDPEEVQSAYLSGDQERVIGLFDECFN